MLHSNSTDLVEKVVRYGCSSFYCLGDDSGDDDGSDSASLSTPYDGDCTVYPCDNSCFPYDHDCVAKRN